MGIVEIVVLLACYVITGLLGLFIMKKETEENALESSSLLLFSFFPIYLLFALIFVILWGVMGLVRTVTGLYFKRR